MSPQVIDIDAAATHDLRRRVLRVGTTSTDVVFSDDDADDTVHLGVDLDGRIVAISTWILRPPPVERSDTNHVGRQLRGMATDPAIRGHGLGSLLLRAGLDREAMAGTDVVWANARIDALGFYLAHGFATDGPQYVDAVTGLPHQRIVLHLGSVPSSATPTVG